MKPLKSKPRCMRIKTIKAVWSNLTIKEELPDYLRSSRKICSSSDVYQLFRYLCHETCEHFLALHLDTKNRISCVDHVSVGSLNASIVHPREVLKTALLSSAAAIALVHNHPSGDVAPSQEDIQLTRRIKDACELIGIRCLDHVIIGSDEYYSFADRGLF